MKRIGVVLSCALSLALAHAAHAEPGKLIVYPAPPGHASDSVVIGGAAEDTGLATDLDSGISPIIFLNRCASGCTITASTSNNAATQESALPPLDGLAVGTKINFPPFPYDDTAWNTMLQCVKEIYSPYNVQITDVDPGPTVVHHEVIVAGTPDLIGLPKCSPSGCVGGQAYVNADRSPKNNAISFAFAGVYTNSTDVNAILGLYDLCATVGQESAHSWGLDHEYDCTDPMTYLNPCGGEKFFRNKDSICGTFAPAASCNFGGGAADSGPTQNSHQMILGVFGPGTSIVPAPAVSLISPSNGAKVSNGFSIFVGSQGKRGTYHVHVKFNGYEWLTKDISDDGSKGNAPIYSTAFMLSAPSGLPDGVIDIEASGCDDIDQCNTATATVTKGNPCTDASQCAKGQKCDAGKCYWDPPTGMTGDACTYPQACLNDICVAGGANGEQICSQTCYQHIAGQCPDGFSCTLDSTGQGYCFADAPPQGCCSSSDASAGQLAAQAGVAALVAGVAFRRRRRRA